MNIFRVALTVALKLRGSEGPAGASSGVNSVEEKKHLPAVAEIKHFSRFFFWIFVMHALIVGGFEELEM